MSIVAEQYTHVVGLDTHARTHIYAVPLTVTGQLADTATFLASPPGIVRALTWIGRRCPTGRTLVSVEGVSSYGAGLTRALQAAARAVAGIDTSMLRRPRASGGRNALRILLNARRSMDRQCTADRHALTALARTMELGIDARKALTPHSDPDGELLA